MSPRRKVDAAALVPILQVGRSDKEGFYYYVMELADDAEDGAHEHDDFESFVVALPETDAPDALIARLALAAEAYGVLRMKGFAAVRGKPMRLAMQGVGARFRQYFDRPWAAGETRLGHVVVIGQTGMDRAAIEAAILAREPA